MIDHGRANLIQSLWTRENCGWAGLVWGTTVMIGVYDVGAVMGVFTTFNSSSSCKMLGISGERVLSSSALSLTTYSLLVSLLYFLSYSLSNFTVRLLSFCTGVQS